MSIVQKNHYDFYAAEFDCNNQYQPENIRKLIICTTPRTAGHGLADHMRMAGWGVPMEYFWPETAVNLYQRWQTKVCANFGEVMSNASDYGNKLMQYRVNNGIFSVKVFPYNFHHLSQCIDLKDAQYIFLGREDLFSQLISIIATNLTGRPFDSEVSYESVRMLDDIDTESIKKSYQFLKHNHQSWEKFFLKMNADQVIRITSENFVSSPSETLSHISSKFGLDIDPLYLTKSLSGGNRYKQDSDIKQKLVNEYGVFIRQLIANDI